MTIIVSVAAGEAVKQEEIVVGDVPRVLAPVDVDTDGPVESGFRVGDRNHVTGVVAADECQQHGAFRVD